MNLTMNVKMLPAPLVNKGFVIGESNCNYEIYLRELLNNSPWFCERYPGVFIEPISESHGENDAINDYYQLDFKLFASSTALRANNLLSPQIYKVLEGVVLYGDSKKKNTTLKASRVFAVFRDYTLGELYQLRAMNVKEHSIENDIVSVLKVLETQKNILLFFPYIFSFEESPTNKEAITSIAEGLNSDFKNAFIYRNNVAERFDTYLTCIYNNRFLLFQLIDHELVLCDEVKTELIPTYCKLMEYCDRL